MWFLYCWRFVSLELVHSPHQVSQYFGFCDIALQGGWWFWLQIVWRCPRVFHVLFDVGLTPNTFLCCPLAVALKKKVLNHWLFFPFFRPLIAASTSATSLSCVLVAEKSYMIRGSLKSQLLCWKTAIGNTLTQAHAFLPTCSLSVHLPATPDRN